MGLLNVSPYVILQIVEAGLQVRDAVAFASVRRPNPFTLGIQYVDFQIRNRLAVIFMNLVKRVHFG